MENHRDTNQEPDNRSDYQPSVNYVGKTMMQIIMRLALMSRKLFIILLLIASLACGSGGNPEEQAKLFLSSLQKLDIDKCIEMSCVYQSRLAAISNEPQFKKDNLIAQYRNELLSGILNKYENDNIVYVFRFPCQWQIIEAKNISQESDGIFSNNSNFQRAFVVIKYNSMDNSPESAPLINKDYKSAYKIKEIILHCDFDPNTGLYMGWGLENHTQW
jgi:hypothetical protein